MSFIFGAFYLFVLSFGVLDVLSFFCFFLFKQKTAYELRISDWSSDVCSSDLAAARGVAAGQRDVDGFGGQARVERGIFELGLARRKRRSDRVARAVARKSVV